MSKAQRLLQNFSHWKFSYPFRMPTNLCTLGGRICRFVGQSGSWTASQNRWRAGYWASWTKFRSTGSLAWRYQIGSCSKSWSTFASEPRSLSKCGTQLFSSFEARLLHRVVQHLLCSEMIQSAFAAPCSQLVSFSSIRGRWRAHCCLRARLENWIFWCFPESSLKSSQFLSSTFFSSACPSARLSSKERAGRFC